MYGLYLLMKEQLTYDWNQDPHPITESKIPHNQKLREVYCPNCKYTVSTSLPGPRCSQCYSYMIVVPR